MMKHPASVKFGCCSKSCPKNSGLGLYTFPFHCGIQSDRADNHRNCFYNFCFVCDHLNVSLWSKCRKPSSKRKDILYTHTILYIIKLCVVVWQCSINRFLSMPHCTCMQTVGGRRLPKFWSPISQKITQKLPKFFTYYPPKIADFPPFPSHFLQNFPRCAHKKVKNFPTPKNCKIYNKKIQISYKIGQIS